MDGTVGSVSAFRMHKIIWSFMEPGKAKNYKLLHYVYSSLMVVLVIIGFPAHLILGLLESKSQNEVLQNLSVTIPVAMLSLKNFCIWLKLEQVHKLDEVLKRLDRRITESDEVAHLKTKVLPAAQRLMRIFYVIVIGGVAFMQLGVIYSAVFGTRRLAYRGYVPFDINGSTLTFLLINFYQFVGLCGITYQALADDTYGPIGMIMIAGHVRTLRMRVSKIASNPKTSMTENNAELMDCIRTHKDILEFNRVFHDIVSIYLAVQIIIAGLNMCILLINVIYSINELSVIMYYVTAFCAMLMQVFPSCYYGSSLETEFDQLTQSIFSCSWWNQDREFKRNFMIFMEQSLRKITSVAGGGMIHINLNSFLGACRLTYSLFALLMQTK